MYLHPAIANTQAKPLPLQKLIPHPKQCLTPPHDNNPQQSSDGVRNSNVIIHSDRDVTPIIHLSVRMFIHSILDSNFIQSSSDFGDPHFLVAVKGIYSDKWTLRS